MYQSLDKYAKNASAWRDSGHINYSASKYLFASGNPFLYFPAATLGHLALETYLKALLIAGGMTACNPKIVSKLDPSLGLKASDCVWDHKLPALARAFASKRPDFDLATKFTMFALVLQMPMTLLQGFELFEPFFSELRYPMEAKNTDGLGMDHGWVLEALVAHLHPFLAQIT
jgi:hypothetical protein